MKKQTIKILRDRLINELWVANRLEWEMRDIAGMFNLSVAQIYRILKKDYDKKTTKEI